MSKITRQIWKDPQQDRFSREVIHELEGVVPQTIVKMPSQANYIVVRTDREPLAIELLRVQLTNGSTAEVPDYGSAVKFTYRPDLKGCLVESIHGLAPNTSRYQFIFRLTWSDSNGD